MRENRPYGSEGGEAKSLPYPYRGGPRQLASASSDNCRGCGSTWVWSVRWVG